MAYDKPFLTPAQQVALLEARGLIISDRPKAESYLERIGYYRLSGYWYPFRASVQQNGSAVIGDSFEPRTEFGTLIDLYVFDKKLRILLLDALERIEIALRVQIALRLGGLNPWAHRDAARLHGNFSRRQDAKTGATRHQEWLRRTDDAFNRSTEEFAKHFRSKYPGEHPPIWIACELWDFGAMSMLFGGMNKSDQLSIAQKYSVQSFEIMESWVRALNVTRNVCAHHSRLWNRPSVIQPKWPTPAAVRDLAHTSGNTKSLTRIYGVLAIVRFLLRSINPSTRWPQRLKTLCAEFPHAPPLALSAASFPDNWTQEALWN